MPNTARIRAATASDLAAVHALVERAYRGPTATRGWTSETHLLGGQRTDPAALVEIFEHPDQRMLVAELDGDVVGCVQIADQGEGLAYLGLLSVDPARQAGGLGRSLIHAAEAEAMRVFGSTRMEMTVIRQRPELVAWYARRGYAPTGEERPFPFDDPRSGEPKTRDLVFVVLAKPLPAATAALA